MAPLPSAGNSSALIRESLVSGEDDPFLTIPLDAIQGLRPLLNPSVQSLTLNWNPHAQILHTLTAPQNGPRIFSRLAHGQWQE
ncbi:hypothetical protein DFH27DRAFT_604974 [Peziza echinospora]|nr:hypothetical protein DFH27DRAFT_604974 [Peziza echinospora]